MDKLKSVVERGSTICDRSTLHYPQICYFCKRDMKKGEQYYTVDDAYAFVFITCFNCIADYFSTSFGGEVVEAQ